jgi:alkylation response protein AidB-like acyl-CoA dehydrogenase
MPNFELASEEEAFRQEVKNFLEASLPPDIKAKVVDGIQLKKDDMERWHKILYRQGWIAPGWPKKFGGCEWSDTQRFIYNQEAGLAGAPRLSSFGLGMCGPVLMAFGTEAQQKRYLPKILSGEEFWCQGYSEPGAGSDLAGLKTRAVRDGDHYVINGSKIWTSGGHMADMMFCLVRTSTEKKKQDGISFLIFPTKTPGVDIQPLLLMNGLHHFNQVFFTDARVPVSSLVGEEGKGWTIAKYLLGHERMAGGAFGEVKVMLERLKLMASRELDAGRPLAEDVDFKRRIADAETQLVSLEQTVLRTLAQAKADQQMGAMANLIKIRRAEIQQTLTELQTLAISYYAQPFNLAAMRNGWNEEPVGPEYANAAMANYIYFRAASIYSGSNEIQRNIVAKGTLGL